MATFSGTETFVDPFIAADSGAGSIGDPYGDLEFALEQVTRDATNGDRFNIKAGTSEILEFALDIPTDYGTPSDNAPLLFQGYTSAVEDGGQGGIGGGATVSVLNDTATDYINFIDLKLHDTGSAAIITAIDRNCAFINCEFADSTGGGIIASDLPLLVLNCYFHNIAGVGCSLVGGGSSVLYSIFENGTNKFTDAIVMSIGCIANFNIINLKGAANTSNGILNFLSGSPICCNSIFSDAGSGTGITSNSNTPGFFNNLIEGFSASGGVGIEITTGDSAVVSLHNSIQNCATDFLYTGKTFYDPSGDESLSASPFTNAGSNDFTPVDTGSVKQGAYPPTFVQYGTSNNRWRGAIEPAEPVSGAPFFIKSSDSLIGR